MNAKDLNTEGCLECFGAHIKLCIDDYAFVHKHIEKIDKMISECGGRRKKKQTNLLSGRITRARHMVYNYETAKEYLFGRGLSADIERFGLPISADYIRKEANRLSEASGLPETVSLYV